MLRSQTLRSLRPLGTRLPSAFPVAGKRLLVSPARPGTSTAQPSIQLSNALLQRSILNQIRPYASTVDGVPRRLHNRIYRGIVRIFAWTGFAGIAISTLVIGFFIYDATTYEDTNMQEVPVSSVALSPRRGGPKNLPIAEFLVDDEDCEDNANVKDKPKVVVLGSGWGTVGFIEGLNPGDYHVTVVSRTNYFLYTPLLPSATVGTLELRSLMQPIRKILRRIGGHLIRAGAVDVDFENKLVEVSETTPEGEVRNFYLPYDKLIIAVGSQTRTFGVEGLEHCHYLKSIGDARKIRRTILDNFERAVLPTTTDEERRKLLSFVVCGGGPTGVEFAAELCDMLNEDLIKTFPRILRNEVSIHLIQSGRHILNTYDEAVSNYAEQRFQRESINVLTNCRVQKIEKDKIVFTEKDGDKLVTKEIPYGLALWSTGVTQTDFAQTLANKLEPQQKKHALETDSHLRLIGDPSGSVYAIGDCSTVQNNLAEHITEFIAYLATQAGKDPTTVQLSFPQWRKVATQVKKQFPQASQHLRRLDKLFETYDKDQSGSLDFQELLQLLREIDKKLTSLPATAQRANQQGDYLARKFNRMAHKEVAIDCKDVDAACYRAFKYKHLGSMAYVGNAAVFDFGGGYTLGSGLAAMYLWRGVYFAKSVGWRTRALLAIDWAKRGVFGRDLISS